MSIKTRTNTKIKYTQPVNIAYAGSRKGNIKKAMSDGTPIKNNSE